MTKCKTLNDITYKDKWYKIGSPIDVDDKDVDKLVNIGAIKSLESIPKVYQLKSKVKINVIKNPIKVEEKVEEIPVIKKLNKKETKEFIKKEIVPRIRRKSNKRKRRR